MSELQPEQIAEEWNPMANGYEEAAAESLTGQFSEEAVRLAGIGPSDRVVDIAAGTGALSIRAAAAGASVLATDFSTGMLDVLRRRAREEGVMLRAEVMNGQDLALDEGIFDAGFSMFGLMMFPDRAAGFGEMYRVLKPGGRGVVGVWANPQELEFFAIMLNSLKSAVPELTVGDRPPSWLALTDPKVLEAEMRGGGFDEVEVYTFAKKWIVESLEWLWERLEGLAPGLHFIIRKLNRDQKVSFGDAFRAAVRNRPHGQAYALNAGAHIAVGRKALP